MGSNSFYIKIIQNSNIQYLLLKCYFTLEIQKYAVCSDFVEMSDFSLFLHSDIYL